MKVLGFMARKLLYVGVVTGVGAAYEYFTKKPDISEWTLHGTLIAVGTAIAGAILSPLTGGSLSKKPYDGPG